MKIVVLGAGRVGRTLIEELMREDHDLTVVDQNTEALRALQSKWDIRTVAGSAALPEVLIEAGARDADMLIAVTGQDETNMVGCQMAYALFQIPTKIARIRAQSYMDYPELFQQKILPIDVCISPEQLVTDYIVRLIRYPGALQVLDFANGQIQLVAVRTDSGGPLVGKAISHISNYLPNVQLRVAAIFRQNRSISINLQTVIEVGDEVFFIANSEYISEIINALGRLHLPNRRVFIAGGGNIGYRLAKSLEENYQVKLIEHNVKRAAKLSTWLHHSIVLLGDAQDKDLLQSEYIENADVFCSVTNDDEANIMSSIQAKRFGARTVMALINRTSYVDLVDGSAIDIAISPQLVTISSILKHVRHADIKQVYSLRRGAAEAIEVVAHGDEKTSKVVGKALKDIQLPIGTVIGALVRAEQALIAQDDMVIQSGDHVILFVVEKKQIHDVERLFQVDIKYFE